MEEFWKLKESQNLHADFFVYFQEFLHTQYIHGQELARNFSSPSIQCFNCVSIRFIDLYFPDTANENVEQIILTNDFSNGDTNISTCVAW